MAAARKKTKMKSGHFGAKKQISRSALK